MGVPGLWKELEPIEQKVSLPHLAVMTGFIGNSTETRAFRVGIDASGWIYRTLYRHGSTESPELVALFSRCSRLFRLPFIPVFVFDGPGRPSLKRGKLVRGNNHGLVGPFQQMLDGFGFEWMMAPGEAEAELSVMSTIGWVDAILTDDSDSFVFGASTVLRIRSEDNENHEASRYSSCDISTILGLSHEDFILIAILAGGDYSDGLEKCGVATAMALARAGLGKRLISGLSQSRTDSLRFLGMWRELLRTELSTNSSGHLPHLYKRLAAALPSDFPDLDVINLYLHPLVSDLAYTTRSLVLRPPRLEILARFAEDHFGWGHSLGILAHFADQLFAGLVIRELAQRALASDSLMPIMSPSAIIKQIVGHRTHQSTGHLAELRLVLSIDPSLLTHALQGIIGRRDPAQGVQAAVAAWLAIKLPKTRAWVSRSMVEHVYPTLVLDYICSPPKSRTRKETPSARNAKASAKSRTGASSPSVSFAISHPLPQHASSSAITIPECSLSQKGNGSSRDHGKRYTTVSVTYQGQEVLEMITDSEGEF